MCRERVDETVFRNRRSHSAGFWNYLLVVAESVRRLQIRIVHLPHRDTRRQSSLLVFDTRSDVLATYCDSKRSHTLHDPSSRTSSKRPDREARGGLTVYVGDATHACKRHVAALLAVLGDRKINRLQEHTLLDWS